MLIVARGRKKREKFYAVQSKFSSSTVLAMLAVLMMVERREEKYFLRWKLVSLWIVLTVLVVPTMKMMSKIEEEKVKFSPM